MKSRILLFVFCLSALFVGAQTVNVSFYESGAVKSTFYTSGMHTERVTYFESGNLMEIATFVNLVPQGEWISFNEAGEIVQRGCYENGEKTGDWVVNSLLSEQVYKLTYDKNERIGAVELASN